MILDHHLHRTLIDAEVIRRNPPAGGTAFYRERLIERRQEPPMKRLPSPRCASATKIVCALELIVATQLHLQPAAMSLSAMISQYFISEEVRMSGRANERQSKDLQRDESSVFALSRFANQPQHKQRKRSKNLKQVDAVVLFR